MVGGCGLMSRQEVTFPPSLQVLEGRGSRTRNLLLISQDALLA